MQKKIGVNHSKYESFRGTNTHTQNKCKYILNVYKKHTLQKNRSFLLNKRRKLRKRKLHKKFHLKDLITMME